MKRFLAILAVAALAAVGPVTGAAAGAKKSHPNTTAGVEAVKRGDFKTAYDLFTTRAATGDAEAQLELGMLYALGNGVERDYVAAWMWTEIAARQKEPYAEFMRDEVAANMNKAEIAKARQEADAWIRRNGK